MKKAIYSYMLLILLHFRRRHPKPACLPEGAIIAITHGLNLGRGEGQVLRQLKATCLLPNTDVSMRKFMNRIAMVTEVLKKEPLENKRWNRSTYLTRYSSEKSNNS